MPDLSTAWMTLLKQATNLKDQNNINDPSAVIAELARRMVLGNVYIATSGQVMFGTPPTGTLTYDVVSTYGADKTGVLDSTTNIQTAIDTATLNGGGTIYFPAGTYKLTAQLTCTSSHMRFIGDGKDNSILQWTDNATKGLAIQGSAATNAQPVLSANVAIGDTTITVASATGINVEDYCFIQDSAAHTGSFFTRVQGIAGTTITMQGASPCALATADSAQAFFYTALLKGIVVQDLTFSCVNGRTTANKLTLLELRRCEAATVYNCGFDGCVGPHITTIVCLGGIVHGCEFKNGQTVAASGVEMQTSTGFSVINNRVSHTSFGVTPSRSPYCRIIGNRVNGRFTDNDFGRGIRIADTSNFCTVEGNTISDAVLFGLYAQDCEYSVFSGNTVHNSGSTAGEHGIAIGGFTDLCKHNIIIGNVCKYATGAGIFVQSATNGANLWTIVADNKVTDTVQRPIFIGSSKNAIIGNHVRANGTTNFQLIDVAASGASNLISGNYCDYDTVTLNAIQTTGGAGANVIGINFLAAGLSNSLHATDTTYLTAAQIIMPQPQYSATLVSTPASVAETTAWTFDIPAATLTRDGQGFRVMGTFNTAANANGKTIKFYVGANNTSDARNSNGETWQFMIEVFRTSATTAEMHYHVVIGALVVLNVTYANWNVTWANTNTVKFTMTNGSASAGDINFRAGRCVFDGIPSTVFA